jgi:hypothetical protein
MMHKVTALAIPTALLASACGAEEWAPPPEVPPVTRSTPSAGVFAWSDAPPPQPRSIPSASEVARHWLLPARNPWAAYQKATLLTALDSAELPGQLPDVEQLEEVMRARAAARQVASAGLPAGTMWVVDLRGAASVAFGAALSTSTSEPLSPVLTFHNWPADNETVPAEETLAALVTMKPRLPTTGPGAPVFLLDAWRLTHRFDRPDEEANDNRYMLTPNDLPAPSVLLDRGIGRVLYVVDSLNVAQVEEDDLHAIFASYQIAGIDISIVDLADLTEAAREQPFVPYYGQTLVIDPDPVRGMIVDDPSFYHRARGGFGGTHVIYGGGRAYGGSFGVGWGGHGGG